MLSLVEPLLKKGRTLWMDNFYNSPALAQRLKLKTDCVGTLCLSRKYVPQRVKEKKLKKGELVAQHSGLVSYVCSEVATLSWMLLSFWISKGGMSTSCCSSKSVIILVSSRWSIGASMFVCVVPCTSGNIWNLPKWAILFTLVWKFKTFILSVFN